MKNLLLFFLVSLTLSLISCKKDEVANCTGTEYEIEWCTSDVSLDQIYNNKSLGAPGPINSSNLIVSTPGYLTYSDVMKTTYDNSKITRVDSARTKKQNTLHYCTWTDDENKIGEYIRSQFDSLHLHLRDKQGVEFRLDMKFRVSSQLTETFIADNRPFEEFKHGVSNEFYYVASDNCEKMNYNGDWVDINSVRPRIVFLTTSTTRSTLSGYIYVQNDRVLNLLDFSDATTYMVGTYNFVVNPETGEILSNEIIINEDPGIIALNLIPN